MAALNITGIARVELLSRDLAGQLIEGQAILRGIAMAHDGAAPHDGERETIATLCQRHITFATLTLASMPVKNAFGVVVEYRHAITTNTDADALARLGSIG